MRPLVGESLVSRLEKFVVIVSATILAMSCSDPECPAGEIKIGSRCEREQSENGSAGRVTLDGQVAVGETARDGAIVLTIVDAAQPETSATQPEASVAEADASSLSPSSADASAIPACIPVAEKCNGYDDDCDGVIDNGVKNTCGGCSLIEPGHEEGRACSNGGQGICSKPGEWRCNGGTTVCSAPDPMPSVESCDGKDNDCDDKVDEGTSHNECGGCLPLTKQIGEGCNNGMQGECHAGGKYICDGKDEVICDAPRKAPTAESCDGRDNDCNGVIDDNASDGPPSTACLSSACVGGRWTTASTPKGTACSSGQCDGSGTCGFCGDGVKNGAEQCDPKVPGVSTFLCSPACQSRHVYTACLPDDLTKQSGTSKQCDPGDLCAAERYCTPIVPSGSSSDSCPKLDGPYRQILFYKIACSIACSSAADCPSILPTCRPTPQASTETTAYCVP